MHLLEALHMTHCGKEGKCMAAAVGRPLLGGMIPTKAQLEVEARVRTLEEEVQQLLSGVRTRQSMPHCSRDLVRLLSQQE